MLSRPTTADLEGEVAFASAEEQVQRSAELLGSGAMLVTLPPPSLDARGRLGDILEELVERELARRGAPSPYLSAWSAMPEDATARLANQLFRARTVGASGLAIAMGTLAAIARPMLTPDDSATLRWLADTTFHASLVLLIDDADTFCLGYASPLPLGSLLAQPRRAALTEPPDTVLLVDEDATNIDAAVVSIDMRDVILAVPPEDLEVRLTPEAPQASYVPVPDPDADAQPAEAQPADAHAAEPHPVVLPRPRGRRRSASPIREEEAPPARERATVGIPVSGPSDAWRTWAIALAGAKGAQPLHAFEKLFTESYVPLAHAIASGLDDARALRSYDEFRRSFERSYTDAFATFGATNRRPRLVMDAFDLASKQARLVNARSVHLLIVDSMRFDLGCLVRDAIARETAGAATLIAETLLWSALPTSTMRQLETLARGLDARRAPAREEPSESLRGRAAELMRRVRVGSRELHKLDLVPAMLEGAMSTGDVPGTFSAIAAATGHTLAKHIATLPARTLVYVVGDHGFTLDRHGEMQFGGASPEEVLVPAQSWFVGDLH